jgi:hypothetical protein
MVKKNYSEAEMVKTFGLTRIIGSSTPRMKEWLNAPAAVLLPYQNIIFEKIFEDTIQSIMGWNEEELKMEFISPLLLITDLRNTSKYRIFYERKLEDTINNYPISVKVDYMIATGFLDLYQEPYFYFQEYKPQKNPSGDSVAQLLQAMLIAQVRNNNGKTIYGATIVGKLWTFVTLEDKTYCISKGYDCTDRDELLQIISILRKFKHILETELID